MSFVWQPIFPPAPAGVPVTPPSVFPDRLSMRKAIAAYVQVSTGTPPLPIGPTDTSMLGYQPQRLSRWPCRAANVQFFEIGKPTPPATPTNIAALGYQPAQLNRHPRRAPYMQFHIGAPPPYVPGPTDTSMLGYFPSRLNAHPRIAARVPSFFWPVPFVFAPAFGPGGPVLVASMEQGAIVALEWATDVLKAWDGTEYRTALLSGPRVSFKAPAQLVDGSELDVRSNIVRTAAQGGTFLLGLSHEEVTITAPSVGTVANVASTALLDWVRVGQRVIAVGNDGTTITAVVQAGSNVTQIQLDTALGAACGARGARIMPLVAVFLDAQQGFARYPVHMTTWSIVARQALFGLVGSDDMGLGVSLTTYTPLSTLYYVWDRGLNATNQASDSSQTLAELVDLGGIPTQRGSANAADWGRQVKLVSGVLSDWQWIKRFLATVRGRQVAFLLPSGRNDFNVLSFGATILVSKGSGFGDPTQFLNYAASSHFALMYTYADGTTQFDYITTWNDNGNGTVSLTMQTGPTGTPVLTSWLELVRFEDDHMEVPFEGGVFTFDQTARVVQQ